MNNSAKTIIFLGAKEIGLRCLEILYQNLSEWGLELSGVLTNERGLAIKNFAHNKDIKVFDSPDILHDHKVDFLVSVQYHKILSEHHLNAAQELALNLHMAPLPEYRGCNQFSFALIDKAETFGTTIHQMIPKIDGGPIYAESRFDIPQKCNVADLYKLTFEASVELFAMSMKDILDGNVDPIPQSARPHYPSQFHTRSEIEELKQIDLNWPQEKILRHLRATTMPGFPPPYTMIDGVKIELLLEKCSPNNN